MISVVLAAGKATRFQSCKQVIHLQGEPLIQHVIHALPAQNEILVVTGAYADQVNRVLSERVTVCHNSDFEKGIGTSIKCAARYVQKKSSDMLLTLADLPFVTRQDYEKLMSKFRNRPVFSKFNKEIGPPAIFPFQYLDQLLSIPDDSGAKYLSKDADTVPIYNAAHDIDYVKQIKQSYS